MRNAKRQCLDCRTPLKSGSTLCPSCGTRVVEATYRKDHDGTYLLSEAEDTPVEHWPSGPWDEALSGGLVPGGVFLLGGEKGCGKSTISLCCASVFAARGIVLYAAGEQVGKELRQTASRLMLENIDKIRVVPCMGGFQEDFGDTLMAWKPKAIFVDSLQSIFSGSSDTGPMIEFVQRLKEYATELQAPCTLISQINSGGQFTGAEAVPHYSDTVTSITVDDETGLRLMLTEKNRYGIAPKRAVLRMRDDGSGLEKAVISSEEEDES